MQKVNLILKIQRIYSFHHDAESHVGYPKDNTGLHLEGVLDNHILIGQEPSWVEAKGIDTLVTWLFEWNWLILTVLLELIKGVTRAKDVSGYAHEVIVDKSAVGGKESHQQKAVLQLLDVWIKIPDDEETSRAKEENRPVANVAKHHPKKERKRDRVEDSWVKLLIGWHAIRVD